MKPSRSPDEDGRHSLPHFLCFPVTMAIVPWINNSAFYIFPPLGVPGGLRPQITHLYSTRSGT